MPVCEGVEQKTPEWLQMRSGMITTSRQACVMAKVKDPKKEAADRLKYKREIVFECLTGRAADNYVSPAMEWGIENEPLALAAYEIEKDVTVEPGGFWIHDEISRWGASPDGLVGDDGLVEVKCPTSATHIDTLITQEIPAEYEWQMLGQMACTGRKWCDFVSFDPRMPSHLRLFIKRFPRNDALIEGMRLEVLQFLEEVLQIIKSLEPK